MPIGRLLQELTSAELTEYMAFDRIEPFGEPRADLRAGIVASAVVNHSMSPPKTASRPVDFMPVYNKAEPIALPDKVPQPTSNDANNASKRFIASPPLFAPAAP